MSSDNFDSFMVRYDAKTEENSNLRKELAKKEHEIEEKRREIEKLNAQNAELYSKLSNVSSKASEEVEKLIRNEIEKVSEEFQRKFAEANSSNPKTLDSIRKINNYWIEHLKDLASKATYVFTNVNFDGGFAETVYGDQIGKNQHDFREQLDAENQEQQEEHSTQIKEESGSLETQQKGSGDNSSKPVNDIVNPTDIS